jgi:hypothetical protein
MSKQISATENAAMTPLNPSSAPPTELLDKMAADAGRGVSQKAEDQLLPILYVLQTNSPQVNKRGSDYVEGAEAGHFFLRGALVPIRDGVIGVEAIPCAMDHVFIEWFPGRQGFVARHAEQPADVESRMVQDVDGPRRSLVRSTNNNIVQDTREFFLLIDGRPYVFPCYGTRHTFARRWQSHFNQYRHPQTGGLLPSFARKYLLTTVPMSNGQGQWYGIKFDDLGWVSEAEYSAARALYEIVARGAQRVEAPINGSA